MIYIVLVFLLLFVYFFPAIRCAMFHPLLASSYSLYDLFFYVLHRKWRDCPYGYIRAYSGLFGQGKTLSAVHYCVGLYRQYHDKRVWCPRRRKMVTQKVHILSNVELLSVPYERFVSLKQLIYVAEHMEKLDDENDTLTVTVAFGDELSVQLNSRSFKNNIDPLFLNLLLTCRHFHIGLIYTSQRFGQVDALLRQVTGVVIECHKFLRFQSMDFYNAWDLENAGSPTLVSPIRKSCWFVRNRDYRAYDTFATVDNLSKACTTGDMMNADEILALQCNTGVNMDAVSRPSKKYMRIRQKKH